MASVKELVRASNGLMNFIDYEGTYRDNNKEFLRGDMWEFSMFNAPKIVYYPGDTIMQLMLASIVLLPDLKRECVVIMLLDNRQVNKLVDS